MSNVSDMDASEIMKTFIYPNAPKQINIPSKIVNKLNRDFSNQVKGKELFSSAIGHVEMILKTSCLPDFVKKAVQTDKGNELVLKSLSRCNS